MSKVKNRMKNVFLKEISFVIKNREANKQQKLISIKMVAAVA